MRNGMNPNLDGFTLIELMIILVIIAVLTAIAVPAYQDYSIRAKISECINSGANVKVQISEYRQSLATWPPTENEAGLNNPLGVTNYCSGFAEYNPATGAFEVDINEVGVDPSLSSITLAPMLSPTLLPSNTVAWSCTRGANTSPVAIKYLPAPCRGAT